MRRLILRILHRIVVIVSLLLAIATAVIWCRSLKVIDWAAYTSPQSSAEVLGPSDWEFASAGGALQITRFKAIAVSKEEQELIPPNGGKDEGGWNAQFSTGTIGGSIGSNFVNSFKAFGWSRQIDPTLGTTWAIRFPYAVPFFGFLVPLFCDSIGWRRRLQKKRRGFAVEPKQ
jgi:hypothetical protein